MSPEEKISSLDLEIKKTQIELLKAESCYQKMQDIRHEEAVKVSILERNIEHLKRSSSIVSLREFSTISKNRAKLQKDLHIMDEEIDKLKKALLLHTKKCDKLIEEKDLLVGQNKKGAILEFKRILKNDRN